MLSTNAGGLRSKLSELQELITPHPIHIITITETKLHPDINNPEVSLENMTVYRHDRTQNQGGGVAVYVYNSLKVEEIPIVYPDTTTSDHEAILLKIHNNNTHFHLLCVYRPPPQTPRADSQTLWLIEDASRKYERLIITGDFNAPNADWSNMTTKKAAPYDLALVTLIAELPLTQHVTHTTRHRPKDTPSLLDLVLTSPLIPTPQITHHTPLGRSDHDCLHFSLSLSVPPLIFLSKPNYGRANIPEIIEMAHTLDWLCPHPYSVEAHWSIIKHNLQDIENQCVPKSSGKRKKRVAPRVRRARERKNQRYQDFRALPCPRTEQAYKAACSEHETAKAAEKHARNAKLAEKIKSDKKPLFVLFKAQKRGSRPAPPTIKKADGSTCASHEEAAIEMQNFFASVYHADDQTPPPTFPTRTQAVLDDFTFTQKIVHEKLSHLNPHKTPGPDNIHPFLLKHLAHILSPHLTYLFNETLLQGIPVDWKLAVVTPLHKSGPKSSPSNYRPISLTSVICKVAEKCVRDSLADFLTKNHLLSVHQHGFRPKHSTLTNLLYTLDCITEAIDEGDSADVVYLDMRKAFDTVNHRLLLEKVKAYGIGPVLTNWIADFLQGRSFSVRFEDCVSGSKPVQSGVPQGSVLGPLLFLLYINDLPDNLSCDSPLFADDGKLIARNHQSDQLHHDLQEIVDWADRWKMSFNASKTQHIHFGNGTPPQLYLPPPTSAPHHTQPSPIPSTERVKNLEIEMSRDLKPTAQATVAIEKAT